VTSSRRESVPTRLARAIERARGRSPNPFAPPNRVWNDERQREIAANIALTLRGTDATLRKAFKEFGLDPKNPLDWRYLLLHLVNLHFNGPPRGSPPKWSADRWERFQGHVATARAGLEKSGKYPSQERIANFLKDRFAIHYRHLSANTIRRYLTHPPPAARGSRAKR
jgi:hypothetical protein